MQSCPKCGAGYRKYMTRDEHEAWGDYRKSKPRPRRYFDREQPVIGYDQDVITAEQMKELKGG